MKKNKNGLNLEIKRLKGVIDTQAAFIRGKDKRLFYLTKQLVDIQSAGFWKRLKFLFGGGI
jgi:hypothetical protein